MQEVGYDILIRANTTEALNFLYKMQDMNMLKVIEGYSATAEKPKLSDRFRGAFSKEAGKSFMEHTKASREEWDSI